MLPGCRTGAQPRPQAPGGGAATNASTSPIPSLQKRGRETDLNITLGVEEEFFLVSPETRDLIADPDPAIFDTCERASGPHTVVREFLRSQIETNTRVCANFAELRESLNETRRLVIDAARQHEIAVIASSTHPFADWRVQLPTPKERYQRFAITYQERRSFLVGGMHIHAGFGDPDSRIRVMTALRRYLPLLNALSASSPFSAGRETGFKSYRLNLLSVVPRFGLPPAFSSRRDYESLLEAYQSLKFIEDGSELWWDLRPSPKYPTIELRICDICTRLDDALAVAAVYASLIRQAAPPGCRRRAATGTGNRNHRRESLVGGALWGAGVFRRRRFRRTHRHQRSLVGAGRGSRRGCRGAWLRGRIASLSGDHPERHRRGPAARSLPAAPA